MPRRREVPKREILPDPKFGNVEVAKFMNVLMLDGKKSVAERIVYGAFDQIEKKAGKAPIEVFTLAIGNIKPVVEVKSRRVGGANYQVPVEVRPSRRLALAMRWLREAAKKRSEKSMALRLAWLIYMFATFCILGATALCPRIAQAQLCREACCGSVAHTQQERALVTKPMDTPWR